MTTRPAPGKAPRGRTVQPGKLPPDRGGGAPREAPSPGSPIDADELERMKERARRAPLPPAPPGQPDPAATR